MAMPPVYLLKVLNDYKKKRSEGLLHSELGKGSPAKLRDACLRELSIRPIGKDEKLLREFFEHTGDLAGLHDAIRDIDIDKLRPLRNFIREETDNPADNVVELLAWLIDFKGRPYDPKKIYEEKFINETTQTPPLSDKISAQSPPNQTESTANGKPEDFEPDKPGPGVLPDQPTGPAVIEVAAEIKKTDRPYKLIISIVITFAAAWILLNWLQKNSAIGHEGCMYWAGDHYAPVSCRTHIENAIVIGLDSEKLVHFRKITRKDTITALSIGSVWYANYKGELECYTSDGFHPIDLTLRLKPITLYILRKYIWKQNVPGGEDSAHISSR